MFAFIRILSLVIDALPAVVKMIDVAEAAIGPGNGASKLEMVKNTVQGAYNVSNEVEHSFDDIWPVFATAIGRVVAANKQAAPVAQPVAPDAPAQEATAAAEHPFAPVAIDPSIIM